MKSVKVFMWGFLLAVFAANLFFLSDWRWVFVFSIPLAVCYVFGLMSRVFVVCFVLGALFGWGRYYFVDVKFQNLEDSKGVFSGCIVQEVDLRRDHVKYTLEVDGVDDVLVLLNGPRYPVYNFGDCLKFSGNLKVPEPVEDFRYDLYLRRYGVGYLISYPQILDVVKSSSGSFFAILYRFKQNLNLRIVELFGEPAGSLISGLLLGSRRGMSEELTGDLQITGLSHIVAISGYNITLVVLFFGFLFGFLSRKFRIIFSLLAIILFVFLVGAGAAVVRAAVMGGIGLLALFYGRQYFVEYALLLTAFLMTLFNPFILTFDSGFHFSFLATGGLIYLAPSLKKWFVFLPQKFLLRENFLMTISAQLVVLPLSIWNFGGFSWLAPLVNLLVLPFLPFVMLISFVALLLSYFSFSVAEFVAFFAVLIVSFLIHVIGFFADLPFGFLSFQKIPWWLGIACYGVLLFIFRERRAI